MLFNEIGMKTVAAGYEFAHRDDYEGRRVMPTIKVDADSRNIEELEVERRPNATVRARPTKRTAKLAAITDMEFMDYEGMMPEMEEGTLVIDDISHYETERLMEIYKPAIFCAGIKEKYAMQKMGIPASSSTAMTTADLTPASVGPSTSTGKSIAW